MNNVRKQFLRHKSKADLFRGHRGVPVGLIMSEVSNGRINFGWALCNPLDRFDKATANTIAGERLASAKFVAHLNNFPEMNAIFREIPDSLQPIALKMALRANCIHNTPKVG